MNSAIVTPQPIECGVYYRPPPPPQAARPGVLSPPESARPELRRHPIREGAERSCKAVPASHCPEIHPGSGPGRGGVVGVRQEHVQTWLSKTAPLFPPRTFQGPGVLFYRLLDQALATGPRTYRKLMRRESKNHKE